MRSKPFALIATVLGAALSARPAAGSLADTLRRGLLAEGVQHIAVESVVEAVSSAVPQNFPLPGASAGFVYEYNPALGTFERLTTSSGPVFAERPQPLGRGGLNLSLSYTYVDFDAIDGRSLGRLRSSGFVPVSFGELVPGPSTATLADIRVDLALEAQILAPSLTYGVTDDLDLNLTLPLLRTFLDVDTSFIRVGEFPVEVRENLVLTPVGPPTFDAEPTPLARAADSGDAVGVGDIALRAKYRFLRTALLDAAGGLVLRLPTGDEHDLHGTGDTELGVFLYAGRTYAERIEPHLNLGVEFVTDDVDRSRFRWAVGASVILAERVGPLTGLNLIVDFIGRNEFQRRVELLPFGFVDRETPAEGDLPNFVADPFLIDIERNDVADFSAGMKITLWRTAVAYFNVIVPLNDDGFRPDFVPSGGLEYTF